MADPRTNPIEELLRDAEWMRALARRLVDESQHVDDAIQDAWVIALEKRDEPRAGSRPWIAGVFRNLARERWRGERARERRERASARPEALPATADVVARAQAQSRLVEAVLALPEPSRSTILLHFFDGMSAEEIARREHVPGSTVRSRLSRGIAELRRKLERDGGAGWAAMLAPLADLSTNDGSALATTGTTAWVGSSVSGGLVMGSGVKLGLGIAGVLALAWWVWPAGAKDPGSALDSTSRPDRGLELAEAQGERDVGRVPATAVAESPEVQSPIETAIPPAGLASLAVRVTWAEDGTPAAGAIVRAYAWGAPDPFAYSETRTADASGSLRFDALHPGKVHLLCQFGGDDAVTVAAGERATRSIAIPVGVAVEGEVVDANGRGVPDAAVWLSDYGNAGKGAEVAHADGDGRFHLRAVGEGRRVAARAPGFAMSPSYEVAGDPGSTVRTRIVLSSRGGSVRGIVRDASGRPVAGALVQAGSEGTSTIQDSEGRYLSTPPPLQVRTDRDGRFLVEGVAAGPVPIAVRARGFAPWTGAFAVEVERTTKIDVELALGAIVRGTIRDGEGRPLDGVFVGCGEYGSVYGAQTRTAADGSFALEGLPSGEVELRADGRDKGKVRTALTLTPGGEIAWDPVLATTPGVSGRVVDDAGQPLANWLVAAVDDGYLGRQLLSKRTDEQGAFALNNWPKEAVRLEVHDPDAWTQDAVTMLHDPRVGQQDLVIRIPRDARATASIEGRIVDEHGDAIAGAQVIVWRVGSDSGSAERADPKSGGFRIAPLRPGAYRLTLEAPLRGQRELPIVDLTRDEHRDLGVLPLAPAGFVRVELVEPPGIRLAEAPDVSIVGPGGVTLALISFQDLAGRSDPLAPGTYSLRIASSDVRADAETITIASGAETAVRIQLKRATSRTLELVLPAGFAGSERVRVVVTDAHGRGVYDYAMRCSPKQPCLGFIAGLDVGVYTVEASTQTGLAGRVTFEVADLNPEGADVSLTLR